MSRSAADIARTCQQLPPPGQPDVPSDRVGVDVRSVSLDLLVPTEEPAEPDTFQGRADLGPNSVEESDKSWQSGRHG